MNKTKEKLIDMSEWHAHNDVEEIRNSIAKEAYEYIASLESKIEDLKKTSFVIEKKNPKCKCTSCKCQDEK